MDGRLVLMKMYSSHPQHQQPAQPSQLSFAAGASSPSWLSNMERQFLVPQHQQQMHCNMQRSSSTTPRLSSPPPLASVSDAGGHQGQVYQQHHAAGQSQMQLSAGAAPPEHLQLQEGLAGMNLFPQQPSLTYPTVHATTEHHHLSSSGLAPSRNICQWVPCSAGQPAPGCPGLQQTGSRAGHPADGRIDGAGQYDIGNAHHRQATAASGGGAHHSCSEALGDRPSHLSPPASHQAPTSMAADPLPTSTPSSAQQLPSNPAAANNHSNRQQLAAAAAALAATAPPEMAEVLRAAAAALTSEGQQEGAPPGSAAAALPAVPPVQPQGVVSSKAGAAGALAADDEVDLAAVAADMRQQLAAARQGNSTAGRYAEAPAAAPVQLPPTCATGNTGGGAEGVVGFVQRKASSWLSGLQHLLDLDGLPELNNLDPVVAPLVTAPAPAPPAASQPATGRGAYPMPLTSTAPVQLPPAPGCVNVILPASDARLQHHKPAASLRSQHSQQLSTSQSGELLIPTSSALASPTGPRLKAVAGTVFSAEHLTAAAAGRLSVTGDNGGMRPQAGLQSLALSSCKRRYPMDGLLGTQVSPDEAPSTAVQAAAAGGGGGGGYVSAFQGPPCTMGFSNSNILSSACDLLSTPAPQQHSPGGAASPGSKPGVSRLRAAVIAAQVGGLRCSSSSSPNSSNSAQQQQHLGFAPMPPDAFMLNSSAGSGVRVQKIKMHSVRQQKPPRNQHGTVAERRQAAAANSAAATWVRGVVTRRRSAAATAAARHGLARNAGPLAHNRCSTPSVPGRGMPMHHQLLHGGSPHAGAATSNRLLGNQVNNLVTSTLTGLVDSCTSLLDDLQMLPGGNGISPMSQLSRAASAPAGALNSRRTTPPPPHQQEQLQPVVHLMHRCSLQMEALAGVSVPVSQGGPWAERQCSPSAGGPPAQPMQPTAGPPSSCTPGQYTVLAGGSQSFLSGDKLPGLDQFSGGQRPCSNLQLTSMHSAPAAVQPQHSNGQQHMAGSLLQMLCEDSPRAAAGHQAAADLAMTSHLSGQVPASAAGVYTTQASMAGQPAAGALGPAGLQFAGKVQSSKQPGKHPAAADGGAAAGGSGAGKVVSRKISPFQIGLDFLDQMCEDDSMWGDLLSPKEEHQASNHQPLPHNQLQVLSPWLPPESTGYTPLLEELQLLAQDDPLNPGWHQQQQQQHQQQQQLLSMAGGPMNGRYSPASAAAWGFQLNTNFPGRSAGGRKGPAGPMDTDQQTRAPTPLLLHRSRSYPAAAEAGSSAGGFGAQAAAGQMSFQAFPTSALWTAPGGGQLPQPMQLDRMPSLQSCSHPTQGPGPGARQLGPGGGQYSPAGQLMVPQQAANSNEGSPLKRARLSARMGCWHDVMMS